jgi:hypothetical protein
MTNYQFWIQFIFWGKVAGGAVALGTVIAIVHRSVIGPILGRVLEINKTVTLLADNHLPHIQKSLNNQDVVLGALKTDVAKATMKIDEFHGGLGETKEAVASLNSALMTHLENASQESALRKKRAIRVDRAARVSPRSPQNIR